MHRIQIYLLTVGTFLAGTSEMIIAGIVDMIADDLDVSIALVGQFVTAFSLSFAIITPIVVTLTSFLERKKVLLGALVIFFIGNVISFLPVPFSVLLITRVILGASAGVFIVVATSASAKLVEPKQIGKAVSTVSLGFGLALVLGVPFGIMVSGWLGWRSIFALLAAFSLLLILLLVRFIPTLKGEKPVPIKQQLTIFKHKEITGGLLLFFFLITGYGLSYTYLVPFLQQTIGISTSTISISMLVFGIFSLIGTRLGGFGSDRWGTSNTVTGSIVLHGLFLILLTLFTQSILLTLLFAALWIGVANATIPALQTHFIQQTPQRADFALSASNSVAQLGIAVGSVCGGISFNQFHTAYFNPWISATIVGLAFIVAYIVLIIPQKATKQYRRV